MPIMHSHNKHTLSVTANTVDRRDCLKSGDLCQDKSGPYG